MSHHACAHVCLGDAILLPVLDTRKVLHRSCDLVLCLQQLKPADHITKRTRIHLYRLHIYIYMPRYNRTRNIIS
jgi:hypothetical protein